jgi:hypothetical protein
LVWYDLKHGLREKARTARRPEGRLAGIKIKDFCGAPKGAPLQNQPTLNQPTPHQPTLSEPMLNQLMLNQPIVNQPMLSQPMLSFSASA